MDFKNYLFNYFYLCLLIAPFLNANENEDAKTDILFLKIQELESEIADLRNKIESQNYLIEKLIKESIITDEEESSNNLEDLTLNADIRFEGVEDIESKDQVYSAAIKALENQNFDEALNLFKYFVESFDDVEKTPLSYFWLG